jgi:threonine synthase
VFPVRPTGIAKSLAIGNPADGVFAVGIARETGGTIEAVDDDEIVDGIRLLARTTGIFTETAGGVTTAVLRKIAERGEIGDHETVVAYITGDGLKTIDAVEPTIETVRIEADPDQVEAFIDARVTA